VTESAAATGADWAEGRIIMLLGAGMLGECEVNACPNIQACERVASSCETSSSTACKWSILLAANRSGPVQTC
jgi:hypothetical protein